MMDDEPRNFSRRDMLKLALAAGATFFFPWGCAFDITNPPINKNPTIHKIPPEWIQILGPTLPEYVRFLSRYKLPYIDVMKVIAPHINKRGSVQNTLPPKKLWKRIIPTLVIINRLSKNLDEKPIEYTSVFRTPLYNALCGGRSHSYHLINNAIDIKYSCSPGMVAAMADSMRRSGNFKGGIGRYGSFTHIDTRGTNVSW